MKMEPIVSSETSAIKTQTPGNYPKRNKLHCITMLTAIYRRDTKRYFSCSVQSFVGPESFLGVSRQNTRRKVKSWMENQHLVLWRVLRIIQKRSTLLRMRLATYDTTHTIARRIINNVLLHNTTCCHNTMLI